VLFVFTFIHKRTGKLNKDFYREKWADIQAISLQESGWVQSVIDADKLLDDALKKSGYSGKTMGERLVSASRAFSDKDRTWAAHKVRNKVVHETAVKLRKNHVEGSLKAFKQALKDLGAL
jgi:hypothetical protein